MRYGNGETHSIQWTPWSFSNGSSHYSKLNKCKFNCNRLYSQEAKNRLGFFHGSFCIVSFMVPDCRDGKDSLGHGTNYWWSCYLFFNSIYCQPGLDPQPGPSLMGSQGQANFTMWKKTWKKRLRPNPLTKNTDRLSITSLPFKQAGRVGGRSVMPAWNYVKTNWLMGWYMQKGMLLGKVTVCDERLNCY